MEKHLVVKKKIGSARHFLHCVILEHRAAIMELRASTRELEAILNGVIRSREDLKKAFDAGPGDAEPAGIPPEEGAALGGLSVTQLKREADEALASARDAIGESLRLRRRSEQLRSAVHRNTAAEGAKEKQSRSTPLSRREREVLHLIVGGKTSKQIAAELGISFKTAVTHRSSIMSKLDVHEIASVVREAIRRELV